MSNDELIAYLRVTDQIRDEETRRFRKTALIFLAITMLSVAFFNFWIAWNVESVVESHPNFSGANYLRSFEYFGDLEITDGLRY